MSAPNDCVEWSVFGFYWANKIGLANSNASQSDLTDWVKIPIWGSLGARESMINLHKEFGGLSFRLRLGYSSTWPVLPGSFNIIRAADFIANHWWTLYELRPEVGAVPPYYLRHPAS